MSPSRTSSRTARSLSSLSLPRILTALAFHATITSVSMAQEQEPIWDIGTKWTYTFQPFDQLYGFVTNEIVDTTRINGLKLYVVESSPYDSGVRYLHYSDDKVYSYDATFDYLQLLYDFTEVAQYRTTYRPICDPYFAYDSLLTKEYTIRIDSIVAYTMPDGSVRNRQYAVPLDTLLTEFDTVPIADINRTILDGIGFMEGGIHATHDWEIGMYICDEFANYVGDLRCFSNDSASYNFVGYPCDSTWVISSTRNLHRDALAVFPNPTSGTLYVQGVTGEIPVEVYAPTGVLLERGITSNQSVSLEHPGLVFVRLYYEGHWVAQPVVVLD